MRSLLVRLHFSPFKCQNTTKISKQLLWHHVKHLVTRIHQQLEKFNKLPNKLETPSCSESTFFSFLAATLKLLWWKEDKDETRILKTKYELQMRSMFPFWIAYEAVKKADLLDWIYDFNKGKALRISHIKIWSLSQDGQLDNKVRHDNLKLWKRSSA